MRSAAGEHKLQSRLMYRMTVLPYVSHPTS
jgi:hypothetical protein